MTRANGTFDVIGQLGALRRYARSLTRDDTDTEDLVQEALARAYQKKSTLKTGSEIRPWLLAILHNVFIDRLRRNRSEDNRLKHYAELSRERLEAPQEHTVRLSQIRAAFMNLPEDQRTALHLVSIEGLSYQEAAQVLGVPVGTLMSRVGRARAALRALESGEVQPTLKLVGGSDVSGT